ncbi:MAG: OmpP1/FadL family transporter [Pseudomonadota bacterium]
MSLTVLAQRTAPRTTLTACAFACATGFVPTAHATNGFNLIGFGAESTLMAGADVAVARDTSALNTNPAGLSQIRGHLFDGFASVLRTTDLVHKDSLGNEEHASNMYSFLGGGGYAQSISEHCTAGVGLFAQGGAGGVFEHLNTAFGTRDELSSLFGIAKVIPGVGCRVNDRLSLGASLSLTYASIEQKVFADTSSRAAFAGYHIENAYALEPGFKLGMQYHVSPQLTLGVSYTSRTDLPLNGDSLIADYSAMGLGKVKYRDVSLTGFALPQEIALGFALKPAEKWLLSFKLNWINWDEAINNVTLRATHPDNPSAPASYATVTAGDWKDQWVIASALAYDWDERTTLYFGHNYGKNPIPRQNTSPLLAGILEHHVTVGMARRVGREWKLTGGLEYMLPVKADYSNPLFGEAQVRNEAITLHLMLSRRW